MKLYTRTICPKCMWIKSEIERSQVEVEVINIDQDEVAREFLAKAGVTSVPVMEMEGVFILEPTEMIKQIGLVNL